jgi:hypothetical protein
MSGSFNRSASRLLADRVKQVIPNPGGPIGASSVITMGAAASAEYATFLTAFGAGKPAYFVLSDGAGKRLTGVWTVNGDGTCTITEIIGSPTTETFAQNCLAWPTIPAAEAVTVRDGPLAGFRNLIINGNPLINQRGYTSGAATSGANQYTLDRWRVVTSGQNASWTDSAGVRTVTAPAGGMEQVIEGAGLIGGTYTLSWTGTATATVGGASVSKGSQVTLTGGADVTVRMSNGTWSLLQLEPGNIATPFEFRPRAAELALCERYFVAGLGFMLSAAGVDSTAVMYGLVYFPQEMRVTPTTVTINNVGQLNSSGASAGIWSGSQSARHYGLAATPTTAGLPAFAHGNISANAEF